MKKFIVVFETGAVDEIECEKITEEIRGNLIWKGGAIYKISEVKEGRKMLVDNIYDLKEGVQLHLLNGLVYTFSHREVYQGDIYNIYVSKNGIVSKLGRYRDNLESTWDRGMDIDEVSYPFHIDTLELEDIVTLQDGSKFVFDGVWDEDATLSFTLNPFGDGGHVDIMYYQEDLTNLEEQHSIIRIEREIDGKLTPISFVCEEIKLIKNLPTRTLFEVEGTPYSLKHYVERGGEDILLAVNLRNGRDAYFEPRETVTLIDVDVQYTRKTNR